MISVVAGRLLTRAIDRVDVMTEGGVAYELAIPVQVFETLPAPGERVTLYTHLVVKDDGWSLYGFASSADRSVFRALLGATGVGPALALAVVSALSPERLVRAIRERDVATLQTVPRVGRKKAEQMILDLADKLDSLVEATVAPARHGTAGDDAARGLVSLGYPRADADRAVRAALDAVAPGGTVPTAATDLIRAALRHLQP